jgi:hypothetical protein
MTTCCCWWRGTCSNSTGKSDTDVRLMLMSWGHGGVGTVIHPNIGIMKVHSTVPCESHLISNCVFTTQFARSHWQNTALALWPGGVRACTSLDVVWVEWLFEENSPDKGNTDTFSSCNSSHTGSGIFLHSSQYANFSKTHPYLSRHWFLETSWLGLLCSFKWVLYPLTACCPF